MPKIQAQFSIDVRQYEVLRAECSREQISFSSYIAEAISRLGPMTEELASTIRQKQGMGVWKYEFEEARSPKQEVPIEQPAPEIPPPSPRKAY